MIERRLLPGTSLRISALGLGCWQLSGGQGVVGGFWPAVPRETAHAVVASSIAGGINFFDTAEAYGGGASEEALADALRAAGAKPDDVVVATKWVPLPTRTARSITTSIDERLARLGGFPVSLFQIHQPFGSLSSHAQQMDALATLVKSHKSAAVGISNFNAHAMRLCYERLADKGVVLASNQVRYSLLDRRIEKNGVLDTARNLGVLVIAYSPLAQGLLSGRFHDGARPAGVRRMLPAFSARALDKSRPLIEALRRIADKHGATPSQVALNWTVTFHGDAIVAIPGATSVRQAEQNAGALTLTLDDDEKAELDRLSSFAA